MRRISLVVFAILAAVAWAHPSLAEEPTRLIGPLTDGPSGDAAAEGGASATPPEDDSRKHGAATQLLKPTPVREPPSVYSGTARFYLDGEVLFAQTRANVQGANTSPVLIEYGVGVTAAFRLLMFDIGSTRTRLYVGFNPGFRIFGQTSSIDAQIGNFSSHRFELLTPTLMARFDKEWIVKLNVKFAGNYSFVRPTYEGHSLALVSPFGVELKGLYSLSKLTKIAALYGGVHVETISYGSKLDSEFGTTPLPSSIHFWSFGLELAFVF